MVERGPGVLIPRIAMPAAHADLARVKIFDCLQRSRQLGRDRHAFDYIRVFEQLLNRDR